MYGRMVVHVLQHVSFEGPGRIEEWAFRRGIKLKIIHMYHGDSVPAAKDVQFLIVMGGPMSVHDVDLYPWLQAEKALLRHLLTKTRTPVLGICLGAQMLAEALGQRVYPADVYELGWHEVQLTPEAAQDRVQWPSRLTPLHWHGETFDLPPAATLLASTPHVRNQAFRWQERALGLQFHLEATPQSALAMSTECPGDLERSVWPTTREAITQCATQSAATASLLFALLDDLADQAD